MAVTNERPFRGRSVWIFARPIQFATIFGTQYVSDGEHPFCHWAVLLSQLSFEEMRRVLTEYSSQEEVLVLGTLVQLSFGCETTVNVSRSLKLDDVRDQWSLFSAEYVGKTYLNDEEIESIGISLNVLFNADMQRGCIT
jgi:hypothetical protein